MEIFQFRDAETLFFSYTFWNFTYFLDSNTSFWLVSVKKEVSNSTCQFVYAVVVAYYGLVDIS